MYRCLWLFPVMVLAGRAAAQDATLNAAAATTPSSVRSVPIYVAPLVYDELALLADTSQTETVRCLLGLDLGDTLIIHIATIPQIHESSPTRVRFQRCPATALAVWHNHVAGPNARPKAACALSRADIVEALQPGSPKLMVVQVNAETVCWWSKEQIRQMREARALAPLPDQRLGAAVTNPP
jgi:hypothetical protein